MIGDVAERLRAAGVAEAGDEAERIATAAAVAIRRKSTRSCGGASPASRSG